MEAAPGELEERTMQRKDGNTPLFSVIILHYQQPEYWKKAVLSVLQQEYPRIELIFADDGSAGFSKEKVETFILQNKRVNLERFMVLENSVNEGTVKNLNRAYEYATGKYVKLFAADDALYDSNVLKRFFDAFQKNKNIAAIYGKSMKCDRDLNPIGEDYTTVEEAESFNKMTWKEQFAQLTKRCCFPIGAMAFDNHILKKYFPIDTSYRLIEDWPLFLTMSRKKERFIFEDFPVLYYRAGGVSDPSHENREHRIQCDCDHLLFHDREIWPYTRYLKWKDYLELYDRYNCDRKLMEQATGRMPVMPRRKLIRYDRKYLRILFEKYVKKHRRLVVTAEGLIIGELIALLIFIFMPFLGICFLLGCPVVIFTFNGIYLFFYECRGILRDMDEELNSTR